MCIEMCIEFILELVNVPLLLVLWLVVLFPSPAPIYLHIIYLPFLLYLIFYIILIQALQTFRNRRNTSPFFCKQKAFTQCNRHVS